jgi:hypothetical protein
MHPRSGGSGTLPAIRPRTGNLEVALPVSFAPLAGTAVRTLSSTHAGLRSRRLGGPYRPENSPGPRVEGSVLAQDAAVAPAFLDDRGTIHTLTDVALSITYQRVITLSSSTGLPVRVRGTRSDWTVRRGVHSEPVGASLPGDQPGHDLTRAARAAGQRPTAATIRSVFEPRGASMAPTRSANSRCAVLRTNNSKLIYGQGSCLPSCQPRGFAPRSRSSAPCSARSTTPG